MPRYKLIYFNGRGRGEVCRLLFHLAGHDFEDTRLETGSEEWKAFKLEAITGQLPVLEIDGRRFSQSVALQNYLAKEFALYGKTNLEALQIDEIVGILEDFLADAYKYLYGAQSMKEAALKEFKEKTAPIYLAVLAKLLKQSGTGFFVGSSVTLADIAAFELISNVQRCMKECFPCMLDNYLVLLQHREKIQNLDRIKQHVEKRH